jgi:hypothetical protein
VRNQPSDRGKLDSAEGRSSPRRHPAARIRPHKARSRRRSSLARQEHSHGARQVGREEARCRRESSRSRLRAAGQVNGGWTEPRKRSGGQAVRRSGGQAVRRSGGQAVRRSGGQAVRRSQLHGGGRAPSASGCVQAVQDIVETADRRPRSSGPGLAGTSRKWRGIRAMKRSESEWYGRSPGGARPRGRALGDVGGHGGQGWSHSPP